MEVATNTPTYAFSTASSIWVFILFPPPPLATQAAEVLLIVKCSVNSPSITASQIPVRFLFPGTIIFEVQPMGFCSFPHPFHNF